MFFLISSLFGFCRFSGFFVVLTDEVLRKTGFSVILVRLGFTPGIFNGLATDECVAAQYAVVPFECRVVSAFVVIAEVSPLAAVVPPHQLVEVDGVLFAPGGHAGGGVGFSEREFGFQDVHGKVAASCMGCGHDFPSGFSEGVEPTAIRSRAAQ